MTVRKLVSMLTLLVCMSAATALAQTLDPANLHVGPGVGSACVGPAAGDPGCPLDPAFIGPTDLSIYLVQNGQDVLTNPVLLILGIPDYSGPAPTIGSVFQYTDFGSGQQAGPDAVGASFLSTGLPAPGGNQLNPGEEIYSASGYNSVTNNSNSFTNWSGAMQTILGLPAPTYFGIYVYEILSTLPGKGLFDVNWLTPLPVGTFAVAYGCASGDATLGHCTSTADTFSTPFTHAGMVVPEPASIFFLGTVLVGIGAMWRRKKAQTV